METPEELLAGLHTEFDRLNAAHFGGSLTTPEIVVSRRKTYGGYYQPGKHRIVVSWQAHVEHGLTETLNTFRHEVAHIPHRNHGPQFWALAHQLGVTQKYASHPVSRRGKIYVYACPSCGKRTERRRQMRTAASCAACDRRYNPRFVLKLVQERHASEVSSSLTPGTTNTKEEPIK